MVFRLISSNWYSMLINGQTHGFFTSSRGVKQGDPLSPTLFIISAEVLSSSLNAFLEKDKFKPFGMPKWSPPINPLSYVDDTLLFLSTEKESVKLMMKKIQQYEEVSGQLVNLNKSAFYVHHKVSQTMSMPLHILSAMSPPIGVIRHIHRLLGRFFWNYKSDTRCRHWIIWVAACLPKEESGLGFRSVFDMSNALFTQVMVEPKNKAFSMGFIHDQQIRQGDASLWFDNWTSLGALYHIMEENHTEEEIEVKQFSSGGERNLGALREHLSEDIVQHIVQTISPPVDILPLDKTWWMLEQNGINIEGLQLSQVIIKCWKYDGPTKVHKTIWQLVRVKFPRLAHVPTGWPELLDYLEIWRPTLHYKKIIWQAPAEGHIKINTDGASRGNPRPSSYGFCCRNHNGDIIYAQAAQIADTTNMLKRILEGSSSTLWHLITIIEDIQMFIQLCSVYMQHIYREGNKIADYLANMALDTGSKLEINGFQDLPSTGRTLINMDKNQNPNLRIKTKKIS
ncbi:uncharacterized protein LOC132048832 [Lycium ferocissimum]|uniref:uncharacterized protein LOC132048832 n=1 Tax=Lycium ferocissimum TaxID=112874 RepID=UPI0028153901|nr:uncharacterized protein LOC132048832 [Lycium ferocissimum]